MPNGELLGGCGALHGELGTVVLDFGGEPQEKTVKPSVVPVVVEPDNGKKLTKVTVNAVTADIDENIVAQNIRGGVEILGVVGELEPDKPNQSKVAEPGVEEQIVRADSGYELEQVTIRGVTSEIDANIVPSNIRKGKTILGVQGNLEPDKPDQSKKVVPSTSKQVVMADNGYELVSVEVDAVTSAIDSDIKAENIRKDVEILGVVGTMEQREDLDTELNEQETLLAELESSVEELQEKPYDMLQWKCDNIKSLYYEFGSPKSSINPVLTDELVAQIMQGIDTGNVITMQSMFEESSISGKFKDLSSITLNMCNCLSTNSMFKNQNYLVKHPNMINLYNLEHINAMFYGCSRLTEVSLIGTSKTKSMHYAFYDCKELITVKLLDMISADNTTSMFNNCSKLTNLILKNIKISLQIGSGTSYGHLLTLESLLNTIKELHTNTGTSTLTLTIGTANLEKLANVYVKLIDITDDMRAEDEYIDNKAPFVQCESTDDGAMPIIEYATTVKKWNIA